MTAKIPEIIYGVLCESARVEASGQISLIGIWGDTCKITAQPPTILPSLAFYVFIRNLDCLPYKLHVQVSLPGKRPPQIMDIPVTPQPDQTSQNFCLNMGGAAIDILGDVVARVKIEMVPPLKVPVEREFHLAVLK